MKPLSLLLLVFTLVTWSASGAEGPTHAAATATSHVRNVGVEEFDKLRGDKTNIVLDVRTKDEFARGHIPGALNLDYNSPDFQKQVGALDKNKTYLVHCAAGVRSARACSVMDKLQFKSLVNLEPGFKAWEKAGKPVEK